MARYGKCGGIDFTGPTRCFCNASCRYQNSYYSQCEKPHPLPWQVDEDGKCGGHGYNGNTECVCGSICEGNQWHKQCVPKNYETTIPNTTVTAICKKFLKYLLLINLLLK